MSTLLIEGGRPLSGAVAVEGNKNAALPLLAACLLTTEECILTNVPRISDVEVMARLLLDLGAEVEGIGSTTLRVRCPNLVKDEPDAALVGRLRGSVLLLGPLLARRGRARLAPPGGDFPARRTIAHPPRSARADGRARRGRARACARGARRPEADLDLPLRSFGDRDRDGAARRGRRARDHRRSVTRPASRMSSSSATFCEKLGAGISGIGHVHHSDRGRPQAAWRRASAVGRLHRGRQLGGRRGRHRRRDRSPWRAGLRTSRSSPPF